LEEAVNPTPDSAGKKTYKTAAVVIPPESTWLPIQAIRERHDRHFQRWMPHINLLYPFRPRREFEAAAARLAQACQAIPPFEVALATFKSFHHARGSYTLWLAPEPMDRLVALQAALWRAFPDCDDVNRHAGGFTPHLSVGLAQCTQKWAALLAAWQSTWTPIRFEVSAVRLIWRDGPPDDAFRVGQAIRLGQV
jgi:2'-5' RNA ligase